MKFLLKVLLLGWGAHGMECSAQTVSGNISGYDFVDLGLPNGVKWATYNVGATKPEEYGNHFAWGETEPKNDYSWKTYKWCKGSQYDLTKYCSSSDYGTVDKKTTLEAEDDAATKNWGNNWRMPTAKEAKDMKEGCTWEWTDDFNGSGIAGRIGTSKTNGNIIFLPASGYREDKKSSYGGNSANYWMSSLYWDSFTAYDLEFSKSINIALRCDNRYMGYSVRAVSTKNATGVPTISNQALQVYTENGAIHINNAQANASIQVSDLNGKVVTSATTDCHGNSTITLPDSKGAFVITVRGQSTKVIIK